MVRTDGPASRRQRIVDLLLQGEGRADAEGLAATLGVSVITVRRDLEHLDRAGVLTRTRGGALLGNLRAEKSIRERQDTNALAKAAIARSAASLVKPGSTVLLDAGTTTGRIARELADIPDLTIVTTGLNALVALAESDSDATIIVTGGTLRKTNQALLGPSAEATVRSLLADVAFIGTDCVDVGRGISSRTPEQNALKGLMFDHARRPIVVADSSKLGASWSTHWFPPVGPVDLLTDSGADPGVLETFTASGEWEVIVAPPASDAGRADRTGGSA